MLSVSMLSGYLYCPRKVYLQYVLKISPSDKAAMVRGSIKHRLIEMATLNEKHIVEHIQDADEKKIRESFRARYIAFLKEAIHENTDRLISVGIDAEKMLPDIEQECIRAADSRARSVAAFARESGLIGERLWQELIPKIRTEQWVECAELNLCGIIDAIEDYKDHLIPIELKTGKAPSDGAWPGHRVQAAAYILLLRDKTDREVKKAVIRYLDQGSEVQIIMNPFMEMEIQDLVRKVSTLLKTKEPPPAQRSDARCKACGLRLECERLGKKDPDDAKEKKKR